MNIIGVQIILLCFATFMIYVLFLHWKRKEINNLTFLIWFATWGAFVFLTIFPKVLEPLFKELFFVRVMDAGMTIAFMILTYITIESNIKIKNLEKKIEKIIRKLSLKNLKK